MLNSKRSSLVLTALALAACGGDDKQAAAPVAQQCPPGQYFDGQICQGAAPANTAPAPAATGPAPVATAPGAPAPVVTAQAGPTATPLDPAAAAAATQAINLVAPQSAPGAKPV